MRTSSTDNIKPGSPYYMLKNKTKKLDSSHTSSRDDRSSLNGPSRADSSLSRNSSSSTMPKQPKKTFFEVTQQTNAEIHKKLDRNFFTKNLVEMSPNIPLTTTKHMRTASKEKLNKTTSDDIVRKILTSPQVRPPSANLESSAQKNTISVKSFSPRFNLDSIYSHKYLLSASKSSIFSPQLDETLTAPKVEVREVREFQPMSKTHSRVPSRAPSVGDKEKVERVSSSTANSAHGSIRSNSKQRDSESSKESKKVFDRLYQEKGLKTLFGRDNNTGPKITLKDITFTRKGELRTNKESAIQFPRYDPGSIASPKIVNYWINSSKENVPQSPKPFETSKVLQHSLSSSNHRVPIIARPIAAIKISENFTTAEFAEKERNEPEVAHYNHDYNKPQQETSQSEDFIPYENSNQNLIQEALQQNREVLRDSTNYYPEPTENSDLAATLKPGIREIAAEKLRMLQREIVSNLANQEIVEEEEEFTPYKPTAIKGNNDLKNPLNTIDEVGECSSQGHSRKPSRSSLYDNQQPVHFHYYIQTGL